MTGRPLQWPAVDPWNWSGRCCATGRINVTTGAEEQAYWGPVYGITREGDRIQFLIEGDRVLVARIGSGATKLKEVPAKGPTKDDPWVQFFRYATPGDGTNVVSYTENRAVDCLPIDPTSGEYFLIRRRDSGKFAVPGGMVDPDEVLGPAEARWEEAALRELYEETGIRREDLLAIHRLSEGLIPGEDPREHAATMPFAAVVRPGVRGFGADDAVPEAMVGFKFGTIPPLHFPHHPTIIEMAVAYARSFRE
jgi:8-oxo-dGTP pyrophosphatase MutT (NUDIX family)